MFQLVSEFLLLDVREEDSGTFSCSALNPAGSASANFTLKVVQELKAEVDLLEGGGEGKGGGGVKEDGDGEEEEGEEEEDSMLKVG